MAITDDLTRQNFKNAAEFFGQVAKTPESVIQKPTAIAIEDVLSNLEQLIGKRKVRELRGVWCLNIVPYCPYRKMNQYVFTALHRRLCPSRSAFEDSFLSEAEKEVFSSLGIETYPGSDLSNYERDDPGTDQVDVIYLPQSSPILLNNLLYSVWAPDCLKNLIFIGDFAEVSYPGQTPLQWFRYTKNKVDRKTLFKYHVDGDYDARYYHVCACEYAGKGPLPAVKRVEYKEHLLPPAIYSNLSSSEKEAHLRTVSVFADIDHNVSVFREMIRNGDLRCHLDNFEAHVAGRNIAKIHQGARELAWILTLKEHYNIEHISVREPCLSKFELDYLNSIGIETPKCGYLDDPEEGVQNGEVALIWMLHGWKDMYNNVLWANRGQMDKIVLVGNDYPSFTKWNVCTMSKRKAILPALGAGSVTAALTTMMDLGPMTKALSVGATVLGALYVTENFLYKEFVNLKEYKALKVFIEKATRTKFRYRIDLEKTRNDMDCTAIMSYPQKILQEDDAEKPVYVRNGTYYSFDENGRATRNP
ncbi:hypothetical protein QR680_004234 [Steinernema hermaphroditum]|uniref:SRR1-like domain-containing protein n=1 Tax=Steinernema hermaphroditum TaxID=289476 RepID=A0AA39HPG3_9BILA|nr:hypothetical protein QR680_004234 [Steinernema hermaphroditum]